MYSFRALGCKFNKFERIIHELTWFCSTQISLLEVKKKKLLGMVSKACAQQTCLRNLNIIILLHLTGLTASYGYMYASYELILLYYASSWNKAVGLHMVSKMPYRWILYNYTSILILINPFHLIYLLPGKLIFNHNIEVYYSIIAIWWG